jgi:UDP-glucose 4-epimerase
MRFLITGISGFVGEELADFFIKNEKNSVLGIDKNQFTSNKKVIFKKCDLVLNDDEVRNIFYDFKPDVVIHCASTIFDTNSKDFARKTNYDTTKNLIELSKEYNVKKFVFFSSVAIFQKNYNYLITENEKPFYKTLYGETKYLAEQMLLKSNFSGDICVLRCPTILGKKSRRIGILFGMIQDNRNIPVIGDWENKHSFIHIKDVCTAVENFLQHRGKYIFNIAANECEEFQYILKRLIKKVNSKSKLVHFNKTIGNLIFDIVTTLKLIPFNSYHKTLFNDSTMLDTGKIKKALMWKPKYSVEEMFEENYLYYSKNNFNNVHSETKKPIKEGLINLIKKLI